MASLLEKSRLALKYTTEDFDEEIEDMVDACLLDLGIAGIDTEDVDALITRAVVTFVCANMGSPSNYDKLKASYDEQKAQLQMSSDYTDF